MLLKQNRRQKFSIGVASVLAATAVVGGTVVSAQDMEQREVTEAAVSRMWKKKYEDMKLNYVDLAQVQNKIRQELTEKLQNTKKELEDKKKDYETVALVHAAEMKKFDEVKQLLAQKEEELKNEKLAKEGIVDGLALMYQEKQTEIDKLSQEVDRKSTRLNSSHANISYAVFCLK